MTSSNMLGEPAPDKTCPVCETPVRFERGYYDKEPIYRCQSCGTVIKRSSSLAMAGILLLVIIGFTIMSCVAGRMVAQGPL